MRLQRLDQATVDENVTAGDGGCAFAGQEHDEIGHSLRRANRLVELPAATCLTTARGSRSVARATVAATPYLPSHRSVSTEPGLARGNLPRDTAPSAPSPSGHERLDPIPF
jgi:hypothetical protein